MRLEWDHRKAESNVKKHGISFERAALVFTDKNALSVYDDHSESEERWITLGLTPAGDFLVVVHTYRKAGKVESVRIISARKASRNEIKQYLESGRE
jgi:uncharacterized DUF497 family protein